MKISIKEKNHREINISVPFFVVNIILPLVKVDEIKQYRPYFKRILKSLKKYVKKNGHFVLVDIESHNSKVKIIV